MKTFLICLLLGLLLTMIAPLSFAQQNQSTQKPNPEIEALKQRISELENQLQTVENVEKMELAAKLAEAQAKLHDANAKLANAEFGKFERELRDSNNKWLWGWTGFFVGILTLILAIIGIALWISIKSLIADRVEKSLNGFKDAVGQVHILQDQIRILKKEHAVSVLEGSVHLPDTQGRLYSETIKALPNGGLLDLIADKTRGIDFRYKAAEVLAVRKNPKLISPVLELLNSVLDSEINWNNSYDPLRRLRRLVYFLGQFHTQETYEGLKKFFSRLLTADTKYKNFFLTQTTFSLAYVSGELNKRDSVPIIREVITDLDVEPYQNQDLKNLVDYFDRFNEPNGIKDILTNGLADRMPEMETRCLELLQKYDPEFVKEWKAKKETADTEKEDTS